MSRRSWLRCPSRGGPRGEREPRTEPGLRFPGGGCRAAGRGEGERRPARSRSRQRPATVGPALRQRASGGFRRRGRSGGSGRRADVAVRASGDPRGRGHGRSARILAAYQPTGFTRGHGRALAGQGGRKQGPGCGSQGPGVTRRVGSISSQAVRPRSVAGYCDHRHGQNQARTGGTRWGRRHSPLVAPAERHPWLGAPLIPGQAVSATAPGAPHCRAYGRPPRGSRG
jgi:hypothetical protein